MKTTVIGGGFISSYLTKRLNELGHEVTVLHHNDKIEIKEADYIFYLASYGNHINQKDELKTWKANVVDYIKLLEITKNIKYSGLIYFSTSSVVLPVQTSYSHSKYVGEIISKRYFKKYRKPIVSVRPFSVYGVGEADFRFIPTIIKHLKSGEPMPLVDGMHDWIHVEDFVSALIKVMDFSQELSGRSVSIGTGKQTSNKNVLEMLMKISGKKIKTIEGEKRPYDTNVWVADTTLIEALRWKPRYTLEQGLTQIYEQT